MSPRKLCTLLCAAALLAGCLRRTTGSEPQNAGVPAAAGRQSANPVRSQPQEAATAAAPQKPRPAPIQQRAGFPAGDLGAVVSPADFVIGELALQVDSGVLAFCRDLQNRNVDRERLVPGKRALLGSSLEARIAEGAIPERYRIGRALPAGNSERVVPVRFFDGDRSASGELLIRSLLGDRYIGDVQLDLADLLKKPDQSESEGRFYPSSYGGLFQGL